MESQGTNHDRQKGEGCQPFGLVQINLDTFSKFCQWLNAEQNGVFQSGPKSNIEHNGAFGSVCLGYELGSELNFSITTNVISPSAVLLNPVYCLPCDGTRYSGHNAFKALRAAK